MSVSGDWEAAVGLRVRRAPPELVRQALRDSLRLACRETCRWTAVLPATVPPDWARTDGGEFPLAKPPEGCAVLRFLAVDWHRGGKLQYAWPEAFGFKRAGDGWRLVDNRGLVEGGDALAALAALEPASTGNPLETVPEDVATDLFAIVAAGAARTLLAMPGAPWGDAAAAAQAAWERQRELGMATSRIHGDFAGGSRITGAIDA